MNHEPCEEHLVDRAVTAEQVHAAAAALGFSIGADTTESEHTPEPLLPQSDEAGDRSWQIRQTTLLLATLEALVVRWQLDQDGRDPARESLRHAIAQDAQAQLGGDVIDVLASALRRIQTVTGLINGVADTSVMGAAAARRADADCPVAVVKQLLTAVGLLLSSSVAAQIATRLDERSGVTGEEDTMLSEETARLLAGQAACTVDDAAVTLREWITGREPSRGPV